MKILITGSAGFIGYHLTKKLIKKNFNIIGIDNLNNYYDPKIKIFRNKDNNSKKYKFFKVDICNKKKLEKIVHKTKPKYIIHLAAQAGVRYSIQNPKAYIESNLIGFFNIIELARKFKIQHIIYASSSSVYGKQKKMPIKLNYNTNRPQSLYAATKKSNEVIAESYNQIFKIGFTGLRFFTNYGNQGRPDMAIYKFTKNILENKKIQLFNQGNHKRDFTHISDSTEFLSRILMKRKSKKDHKIFNLASGKKVDLKLVLNLIEKNLNKKAKILKYQLQKGDVKETHADISETIKLTNYKPRKNIKDGIKDFIEWFKSHKSKI